VGEEKYKKISAVKLVGVHGENDFAPWRKWRLTDTLFAGNLEKNRSEG
jgi:hypothetical protein